MLLEQAFFDQSEAAGSDEPAVADRFRPHAVAVDGPLRPYVTSLLGVEVGALPPMQLSVVPHEALMLYVQIGRGADCLEQKAERGLHTRMTGIRRHVGRFVPPGNCQTVFAMLTPLGAVNLLGAPLDDIERVGAPAARLLDLRTTRALELDIAAAAGMHEKLERFGRWLEARVSAGTDASAPARRAARTAMRIYDDPSTGTESLAQSESVTRRQLERDMRRWLNVSPNQLAHVARLQALSRHAMRGRPLAHIAADLGYADQAHMSRTVKSLTGTTPRGLVRAGGNPMALAFRRATGGGVVYL